MIAFEWPGSKRQLAVLGVLVLVVTAGCAGLGGEETSNDTDAPDNTTDPGDEMDGDDNSTDGSDSSDRTPPFGQVEPVEGDLNGEELLTQTVDALENVDSYALTEATTSTAEQNNQQFTVQINRTFRVDRAQQQLAVEITQETQGRSASSEQYLQDGVLYQRSAQIARQYGTEWLRTNVSDGFDQQFQQFDQVRRLEQLLGNASATLEGRTEIDGQQAYAVSATVDPEAVTDIRPTVVGTERVELDLWISTETSRPLQVTEDSAFTEQSPQGELPQETNRSFSYTYRDVQLTLPDAAKNAPFSSEVSR